MCEGGGLLQASPSTGGDILTAGGASERLGSEGGSPLETQPGDLAILSSMVAGRRSEAKSPATKRERRPRRGGGQLIPAAGQGEKLCHMSRPPPPVAEPSAHGQARSRRRRRKGLLIPDVPLNGEPCNMLGPPPPPVAAAAGATAAAARSLGWSGWRRLPEDEGARHVAPLSGLRNVRDEWPFPSSPSTSLLPVRGRFGRRRRGESCGAAFCPVQRPV